MPDTNDQTIANPQSLVDAALGSTPPTPAPVVAPEPVVTMGDETPLAFVAPEPATLPPIEDIVPPVVSPVLPPVVPPAPVGLPKKKSKMGIVIGGVLLLVLSVGGGVWGYQSYLNSQTPQIAGVDGGMDTLTGSSEGRNVAVVDGKQDKDKLSKDDRTIDSGPTKAELKKRCDAIVKYGAVWDDQRSACKYPPGTGPLNPPDLKYLLCGGKYWDASKTPDSVSGNPCNSAGCTLTQEMVNAKCEVQKVNCKAGGQAGVACNEEIVSTSNAETIDKLSCGSQQIDIVCKSLCNTTKPIAFANKITGKTCASTKTNETETTMACTGLAQTPVAPVMGSVVTFTCTGTVTPPVTGAISYKYRYSINNGSYVAMTSNTLTVAACGTYKVECQACATLDGVLKCAPVWTGATQ